MNTNRHRGNCGTTLVETLVAAAVAGVILAAIVVGGVTLQRSLLLANRYFQATSEELLVADWIAADVRAAIGASVTPGAAGNQVLTLIMPDFVDAAARTTRTPTVSSSTPRFGQVTGTVDYGDPAARPTVVYSVSDGRLLRQAQGHTAVLSNSLQNFQLNCVDQGTHADVSVSFSSKFARTGGSGSSASTTLRTIVYMRNPQRL